MLQGAIDYILEMEGGFVDKPADKGGPTLMGISSRSYPALADDIVNQTLDVAVVKTIYAKDYYYPITGIEVLERDFPDLAWLLFSGAVHGAGDNHLVELIQRHLNVSAGIPVNVDGVWGPKTLEALSSLTQSEIGELRSTIDGSVETLARRRVRTVGAFEEGILNRVYREHEIAKSYRESRIGQQSISQYSDEDGNWICIRAGGLEIHIKEA